MKDFFLGSSQLHYRLILRKQFWGILCEWKLSNRYFSILYKMLEKQLWNSFLLYLVVEILQLVNEIAVSQRCSIKEAFFYGTLLKNFSKFAHKHKNQSSVGVLSKEKLFLKILRNSQKNIFARVPFSIKLHSGNLKLSEAVAGDVL